MKIHAFLSILLFSVFAAAIPTRGQTPTGVPTRIAIVDVNEVLTESTAGKEAYAKLKRAQDERVARAKAMDEELRKIDQEISAQKRSEPTAKLNGLEQQLVDKRMEMQRYAQTADREISEMRERELQTLEQRIKPVIDALATEMKLAAVFNKFESGLVYASDRIDITEEVVRRFNAVK